MKIELVDLYDENKIKIKGEYNRYNLPNNNSYYFAINIWIIIDNKNILVQKRSASKKIYPNKWECIAGGVLANESLLDACLREAKEELNLLIDRKNIKLIDITLQKEYRYFMHTYMCNVNPIILKEIKINKDEVSEYKIINYKQLIDMINNNEFSHSIKSRFNKYKENFKSIS